MTKIRNHLTRTGKKTGAWTPARLVPLAALLFVLLPFTCPGAPFEVTISGVEGKVRENVRDITALPAGLVQDGEVNEPLLRRFMQEVPERAREALKPFGYYNPKISTDLKGTADGYQVAISIDPGPPVIITKVNLGLRGPGKNKERLRRLVDTFPLKEGEVLLQDVYEEAKNEFQARALDLGFLDADFYEHAIRIWTDENRAEIALALDTGPQYFFNGVVFAGAPDYPEPFLRRYLAFKPGDVFSFAKLGETQVNLNNSQRFRGVVVTTDRKGAKDYHVPVRISLTPAPSQQLRIGGGYGTDTGPRFLLRYQDLNIFKKGHEFEAALDVSQRIQGIATRYVIPSTKSYLSYTAFRFAYLREDVETYTTNAITFDIDRERSLGVGRTGAVFLRFLREESDIGHETTTSFIVMPGVRFVTQRYDNVIRPRRGYRLSTELRGTSNFLGSDQSFLQFIADGGFIRRLSANFTLVTRARVGWTIQRESINDLPATLRFFAGGDRSVRGYAYQSLGPRNDAGDVIGGKNLLVGSVELERAIGENWGVAAFYDAGNAFDDFSRVTLFQGVGLGVRYYSPVGPIRLDFAHPLDTGAPIVRIHLTIGFAT